MPADPNDAAVLATRRAVREVLRGLEPGSLVLAAVSGGADSLALAAALAAEGPRIGLRVGAVSVDHALQDGSREVSEQALRHCERFGLDPRIRVDVQVQGSGAGPEADARTHRYAALDAVAEREHAAVILLGHTLDDQAEQVLLGVVRGSGTRSLSGMPRTRARYRRPFLAVTRAETEQACAAYGIAPWQDPHNDDPAYTRVKVRHLLAQLETALGPGIAPALARSADQLRADADHLDQLADLEILALGEGPWPVEHLAELPVALRGRVWRRLLIAAGAPAGQLSSRHTAECDRLLTDWRGQGPIHAPGPTLVSRSDGRVHVESARRVE